MSGEKMRSSDHRSELSQYAKKCLMMTGIVGMMIATASSEAAIQNLSTVTTVYQSDWSSGSALGWTGTTNIVTADRRGNSISPSLAVGGSSEYAYAYSPVLPASSDGSFRLSFVVQFDNSGSFSTNWGDIYLYNSQTGANWQIRIQQVNSDNSVGIQVRQNGNTFADSTASFNWATGAVNSVSKPVLIVAEYDDETNTFKLYATYNLSADISTLTPLISTTTTIDITGLDQIKIQERGSSNKRFYSSITLATNSVPEAASLGILGFAGTTLLIRRKSQR